ncbi:alpha/beta fold hydrolase [Nocardia sp. CDC153]|uniref:alpha/beta fold hydrolase n=1 Tax=Nocardia sp. CDC153 TaxID=3112167 RepID=UPI002DBBF194|nr:alpha/beta fold hydrolase [Nocardia sp. CDC153]MEC3956865.1 alpha/beta fold hydrolase [Nocardia sp. CDC153]
MSDDHRARWRHRNLGVQRELSLSSGRLAYFEVGDGEPLVFLHGPLMNANVWRKVIGGLSGRFRCIALDLPWGAHAIPMPNADLSFAGLAALVAEALEQLNLAGVTLVGSDGGTPLAQLLALSRPDLVGRLVLTSGGAYDNAPPRRYRPVMSVISHVPFARELVLGPLRIRALRRLPFAQGWLARRPVEAATSDSWVLPALIDDEIYADLRRALRSLDPGEVLAASKRLREFTEPVLIAWAARDRLFPPAHAERLADDFFDARLEWVADSHALVPEDQPAALAGLIADFVPRTRPVRVTPLSLVNES